MLWPHVDGVDVVLVLTEWQQFRELKPSEVGRAVRVLKVLDGRNCLDRTAWESAGWNLKRLGGAR